MRQLNLRNFFLTACLLSISSLANAGVSHFGNLKESHEESRFVSSENKESRQENDSKKPEFKSSFSKVVENDSKDREDRKENETITSPVPEPETYAMILAGLLLVGFSVRRRNRNDL
jgi:hypothetical protein